MTGDTVKNETGEGVCHKRIPLGQLCSALGLERRRKPVHVRGTSVTVENRVAGAPDHIVQQRHIGLCLLSKSLVRNGKRGDRLELTLMNWDEYSDNSPKGRHCLNGRDCVMLVKKSMQAWVEKFLDNVVSYG